MIKPSDDCIYFFVVLCGVFFLVCLFILAFTFPVGASSGVTLTPGRIKAESCSDVAVIPIINWTAKGSIQIVELRQSGDCLLRGTWNKGVPGLYCTGIGSMDGYSWVPDECVTVSPARVTEHKTKSRNVFKYRYP